MIFLLLVFLASLSVCLAALITPLTDDLLLLALPCAAASLTLILHAFWKRRRKAKEWIIVDGSNVMYWKGGVPNIQTVREVIEQLLAHGYAPGVVFDANAGYKLAGRFMDELALARLLRLPVRRVHVVPKGTPADPFILAVATGLGARIVTNDRFRDWVDVHPEIRQPSFLIRGRYEGDALVLTDPATRRTVRPV